MQQAITGTWKALQQKTLCFYPALMVDMLFYLLQKLKTIKPLQMACFILVEPIRKTGML